MADLKDKCVVTCSLTGVLTNPKIHPVPVTPEQMAAEARRAADAGATIVHCHFRDQRPDMGHLPSWDPKVAGAIIGAIKAEVPEMIINMSTGMPGRDFLLRASTLGSLDIGSPVYYRQIQVGQVIGYELD